MSSSRSLTSIDVSEYDRIEAAMTESERGRWFLDEYVRRNRTTDTEVLLSAIARLESVVTGERETGQIGRVRGDLMDMAHAIARTKAEITAISAPDHDQTRLGSASMALDAIVRSTERATSDILSAAEDVQEAAWTLRESGSDPAVCDTLDRRATEIYTACSFQDLTAQRTARIIHTLRYLEERLATMMAIWGDGVETVPPAPGEAAPQTFDLSQSDVDRFIDMEAPLVSETQPEPRSLQELSGADDIVFIDTDSSELVFEPATSAGSDGAAVDEFMTEGTTAEDIMAEDITAEDITFEKSPAVETATLDHADADADADPALPSGDAPVEKIDIAAAFADIDRLSDEEKRALFS